MHIHCLNELNTHLNNYFLQGRAASQSSWELFPFSNFLSQPCTAPVPERQLRTLNLQVQAAPDPWGCVPSTDGDTLGEFTFSLCQSLSQGSQYLPVLP